MNDLDRITELESRLTHLDDTVEQLNDIIVSQQNQIAQLETFIRKLANEHSEMKEQFAPEVTDSRPPHY